MVSIVLLVIFFQTDSVSAHLEQFRYWERIDQDSAAYHLDRAIHLGRGQPAGVRGQILNARAEFALIRHQYDSVYLLADKALNLTTVDDTTQLINLFSVIGTAHYYQGDYALAIAAHQKAERLCDPRFEGEGTARVFNNLGIAYIKLTEWDKAEAYMKKSLAICRQLNITRGISYTLGNLGIIYKNQGDYDQAIRTYLESIKLNIALEDQTALARNYDNIGSLYEQNGVLDSALHYYLQSLKLSTELNNPSSMGISFHNLGSIYGHLRQYEVALDYYDRSLKIARELHAKDLLRNVYLGIAETQEARGDAMRSLEARKLYESWKDSIVNEDHLQAISELEIRYESEKKAKEILTLKTVRLQNEAAIARQSAWIRRLGVGMVAGIVLLIFLFIIIRQRSRYRRQQALISAIADTQDQERTRIARDLHDSVGGSLALIRNKLQLTSREIPAVLRQQISDSVDTLSGLSEQIRQIAHDMMPGELMKFGLVAAVRTTLDQLDRHAIKATLYTHQMEKRLEPAKEIHVFRILQELIQNALKHSGAKHLVISLTRHQKHLNLLVEDDGRGLTPVSGHTGLGLANIRSRVELLHGDLSIDTSPESGTTFNINIPIST